MLCQGRIVWVTLSDQSGRNPKHRPAIIVTPTADIDPAGKVVVVAATSTFTKPLPVNLVPLPWQNGGHPVTRLYKPCVAVCDWVCVIPVSAIGAEGGVVPKPLLDQILLKLPAE
jgi:mRNA-degrading endonuclease toxin of MazEF toxin-antitoxin module